MSGESKKLIIIIFILVNFVYFPFSLIGIPKVCH